jgi:hypothetical protein
MTQIKGGNAMARRSVHEGAVEFLGGRNFSDDPIVLKVAIGEQLIRKVLSRTFLGRGQRWQFVIALFRRTVIRVILKSRRSS